MKRKFQDRNQRDHGKKAKTQRPPNTIEIISKPPTRNWERSPFIEKYVTVATNCFECESNVKFNRYGVHFIDEKKEEMSNKLKTEILLRHDRRYGKAWAFNGSTLICEIDLIEDRIRYQKSKGETVDKENIKALKFISTVRVGRGRDGKLRKFEFEIKPTKEMVSASVVIEYLSSILKTALTRNDKNHKKKLIHDHGIYFNPDETEKSRGLSFIPGYSISFYEGERSRLMGVCGYKKRVIRSESVWDYICDMGGRRNENRINRELEGKSILTTYAGNFYRVARVDWKQTPFSTFKFRGKEISYAQYLGQVHNLKDKIDERQPLLSIKLHQKGGNKRAIKLIPQFCKMTGVNEKELGQNRRYLVVPPKIKLRKITQFVALTSKHEGLKKFGLLIKKGTINVKAHILGKRKIGFRDRVVSSHEWKHQFKTEKLKDRVELDRWIAICEKKMERDVWNNFNSLKRVNKERMAKPLVIATERSDSDGATFIEAFERRSAKWKQDVFQKIKVVYVLLPDSNSRRYNTIKRYFSNKQMIVQCQNARNRKSSNLAGMTNILLQINAKLNYRLWVTSLNDESLMTVGIDVLADKRDKRKLTCGFVASYDRHNSQHYHNTIFTTTTDLTGDLELALKKALKNFGTHNRRYPEKIIIYRNSLTSGDFVTHKVKNEVNDFVKCVDALSKRENLGDKNIKIVYVTLNKKTRFKMFKTDGSNVDIGTVVDRDVTNIKRAEFYLASTTTHSGCVNPVKYQVLYNDSGFSLLDIQNITFSLTHLYYNWGGTVRIPAPVMYATKIVAMGLLTEVETTGDLKMRKFYL